MLFNLANTSDASIQKTLAMAAAFSSGFVVSDHLPVWIAIVFGMASGTLCAWARERQNGTDLPRQWLVYQMAAWGLIAIIAWSLNESPGLSIRWTACVAGLLSFASREGLQALHRRAVKKIGDDQ